MLSLLNPYVIIALTMFFAGFGVFTHHQGYVQAKQEMADQVVKANDAARTTEHLLTTKLNDQATTLRKVQKNADQRIEKLKLDVGTGVVRLSVPTHSCVQAAPDATPTSGNSGDNRAELDRQTAESLISIAADGDAAIRKHAACVATYNEVMGQLNANR